MFRQCYGESKVIYNFLCSLVSSEDVTGFSGPESDRLLNNSDEDFSRVEKLKPSGLMTRVSYSDQRFL